MPIAYLYLASVLNISVITFERRSTDMRTLGGPIAIFTERADHRRGGSLALRVAIQGVGTVGAGLAAHGVAHNRIA